MPRRLLPLLLVWLVPAGASAFGLTAGDDGPPARWFERTVRYAIDREPPLDVPAEVAEAAVHAAFEAWAGVPAAPLRFEFVGPVDPSDDEARDLNVVHWTRGEYPFTNEALALTAVVYEVETGRIVDADIYVDEVAHGWRPGEGFRYDLQSSLTHEVGHLLGLGHSSTREATMYPSLGPYTRAKRTLDDDDIEGLRFLYGGGSATYGQYAEDAPAGGGPEVSEETVATACRVGFDAAPGGGSAAFVLAAFVALRRRARP